MGHIQYIKGDLFSYEGKYILHGCNAQGVMGSGVAAIVRKLYPQAFEAYRHRIKQNALNGGTSLELMGENIYAAANGKIIINSITQQFFGGDGNRYVSYDAVDVAMQNVNKLLKYGATNSSAVAMPMIGAGLGGGKWEVIAEIIEHRLTDVHAVVYYLDQ